LRENKRVTVKKYKKRIAFNDTYNGKCYVCEKKFGKRFAFHHKKYIKYEKTYRDFKNNDNYQLYILPIIESRPRDFTLLCHKHHYLVEILKRFKPERLERLFCIIKESYKR